MKLELVLIPSASHGHLPPLVELTKLLVDGHDDLSITVIVIPPRQELRTPSLSSYISSLSTMPRDRIRFIFLSDADRLNSPNTEPDFRSYSESYKPAVKATVAKLNDPARPDLSKLVGFVVDMFCTQMIDVANEFNVPSYLFYPSSAAFLGLQVHMQYLCDVEKYDVGELRDSDAELEVPFLTRSLPAKCVPSVMLNKEWLSVVLSHARRFQETKEQQLNAFEMVEEMGLAVEIRNHFQGEYMAAAETNRELITAEEIERRIGCLMKQDSDVRDRVKKMSEKSHVAVMDGGSSHHALVRFIQDVTDNISSESCG
ncbi:hypothetical protein F2Q68_00027592 [Brassica cretica]|uniref:UDP-glycosyltransferases domain-containing protein n=2 Tax=Brassica cretica TaxID=69181 RepID=A0A8S9I9U5_BRACR|nr:hypothetical protein F2Q68_00027592 [Brassica cretica]